MSTRTFHSLSDYARHMRACAYAAAPEHRLSFLRRVMGEVIRDFIKASFLTGKDPRGEKWQSNAAETQLGGRWAASYHRRPSGAPVSADKIRLTDTGELRESYNILRVTSDEVIVGPDSPRSINIALRAETVWGNAIAGWGPDGGFRESFAMAEVNRAWEHMMNGVPLSRIRKPRLRAL